MTRLLFRCFASLLGALPAITITLACFDPAEARGRGGGARMHGHHGHHSRPHHANRPHNRPHHRPAHGNHHVHHAHDRWHGNHHRYGYHHHYGRWGAGVVTGLAVGAAIYSLPRGCSVSYASNVKYWNCNGVWYRARYRGSDVVYVVVDRP